MTTITAIEKNCFQRSKETEKQRETERDRESKKGCSKQNKKAVCLFVDNFVWAVIEQIRMALVKFLKSP
jgi:hypothetical protein